MDATIAIATFGDQAWLDLALEQTIPAARDHGVRVVHAHGRSLADARNVALREVRTEFVVHLDADDSLAPGYLDAMAQGTADVRAPAVSYIRGSHSRPPYVPRVAGHQHDCSADCITSGAGNWLVIGTAVRAQAVRDAGGWREWDCYEDFDLWMRVLLNGATVEAIPSAVYRAAVRSDSRNRAPSMAAKDAVHRAIVGANLPNAIRAA